MSETTKTSDTPRKIQDTAARSAQVAGEAASKPTKEAAASVDVMANAATESAKQAERTASTVSEASTKVASHATNVAKIGLGATEEATGRMADFGYDRSRRLLASTAQAMDLYAGATERSAERMQALMSSAMTLTHGLQKMQHAWLEILDETMERATHRPQDLLRCKTLTELAEVQCDLYKGAIEHAFETSSRLLELAGSTAQEAIRPLQARMH